ncbi:hypothetical protein HYFRA_00004963 [Hymenoscyphus fraxineus]|uniref:HAD-like protein n=1 Tax=Hymenoscyphus fraxineus TaxID=746836 RepID=A0A9N9KNQ6_9HELO|nr:hypothetical protein HYFRA_00004963 [Hymenoscyphus fraxineus]
MNSPKTDFPPVRACLLDMDGLLIDSEDKYTICDNMILAKYGRPPIPWSIKAQLQGRPGTSAVKIMHEWSQLPITIEEYQAEQLTLHEEHFPSVQPLLGVSKLLSDLSSATVTLPTTPPKTFKVHTALATSSMALKFKWKTSHLEELFSVFPPHRRVLGDDPRIPKGRGKPAPEIYLLALDTINQSLDEGEPKIKPEECLVFEDSVPGVEAGRRAGMRVVWIPHPGLAGETGEGEGDLHQIGEVGDGWGEQLESLEGFDWKKYGIEIL